MRIIETKVYQFDELSDEAKQVALEQFGDVNVEYYEWWHTVYDDANDVGIKITEFNLDRANYINGEFKTNAYDVANKILKNHGETCDTYILSEGFLSNDDEIEKKYPNRETNIEEENDFDSEIDELKCEYEQNILNAYLQMLKDEYKYLTSESAIIDTIRSNEYEFTEDGKLF